MHDLDAFLAGWSAEHEGRDPRSSRWVLGWLVVVHRSARPLARRRIPPASMTAAGVLCALVAVVPAAAGGGRPLLGAVLVVLAALADGLDGAVAVMTATASARGRRLDRLADRVGEIGFLACLVVVGAPVLPCAAVAALTVVQEGLRARSAGRPGLTVWERPTRVVLTAVALTATAVGRLAGVDLGPVGPGSAALALLLALVGLVQLVVCRRAVRSRRADEVGDDPGRERHQREPAPGVRRSADEEQPGHR